MATHAHHHTGDHPPEHRGGARQALLAVAGLTSAYMVVEFAAGYWTGSLALMADAGHMLIDVTSLLLGIMALVFASMPVTERKTFGFYRLEILAALANGCLLLALTGAIAYEAIWRLLGQTPVIRAAPALGVAVGGLAVNIVGAWLLHRHAGEDPNVRAAAWHVLSDLLGSLGAIVAMGVVLGWGWRPADAVASLFTAALILFNAWRLVREATDVLLQGTPACARSPRQCAPCPASSACTTCTSGP
jgi:cobalt-zinc-cadmium efflux system protein